MGSSLVGKKQLGCIQSELSPVIGLVALGSYKIKHLSINLQTEGRIEYSIVPFRSKDHQYTERCIIVHRARWPDGQMARWPCSSNYYQIENLILF